MKSSTQNLRRLSIAIALSTAFAMFAASGASARIVDDYFRDTPQGGQSTSGRIVDRAVQNRLVDDSFRNAGGDAAAMRALMLRSEALDRKYHLGRYAVAPLARQSGGFDWGDAGIGAAAILGLVLFAGGAVLGTRKRRTLAQA
jgi:hypothetical protein